MNITERLGAGTSDLRYRIERAAPLLDEGLTREQYRGYLGALLGFYEPAEAALAEVAWPFGFQMPVHPKARLIAADLHALELTEAEVAALPRCVNLPKIDGVVEGFGWLYVLEGAALGGQLLQRHVERQLGMSAAVGTAFLSCCGAGLAALWRTFYAILAEAAPRIAEDRLVMAARASFGSLEAWMWSRRK